MIHFNHFHAMCVHVIIYFFFRDGMPSLSSSYNISGLVPVCWLLFQCFRLRQAKFQKVDIFGPVRAFF